LPPTLYYFLNPPSQYELRNNLPNPLRHFILLTYPVEAPAHPFGPANAITLYEKKGARTLLPTLYT